MRSMNIYRGFRGLPQPIILEPSLYKYNDAVYALLEVQWRYFFERLLEGLLSSSLCNEGLSRTSATSIGIPADDCDGGSHGGGTGVRACETPKSATTVLPLSPTSGRSRIAKAQSESLSSGSVASSW